jgi:hypothetical protein
MLAIRALQLDFLQELNAVGIGVGVGILNSEKAHLFDSSFYEKTLNVRRQLVSPALDSDKVFPWIRAEKENATLEGKRVHLICGKDDVVVGEGGAKYFKDILEKRGNEVSLDEPARLQHHEPGGAASFIYHFLKKTYLWR